MTEERKAQELAKELSSYFNTFNTEERFEKLSQCLLNEHRTLQQTTMKFFIHMMKTWSETEFYDGRNQATIELSKKIVKEMKDDLYLPMV